MLKICSCSKLAPSPATVCLVPELSKALAKAAQPPLSLGWFGSRGVSAAPGGTVHSWRGISRQSEGAGRRCEGSRAAAGIAHPWHAAAGLAQQEQGCLLFASLSLSVSVLAFICS